MAPASGSKAPATEGSQTVPPPPPTPITNVSAPPPFLVKTYDMVEDSSTDEIVSWSDTNNSFIVWDPPEFGRSLLPKYFKHSNYSSFVRQLNTYGFRKVDPDRWEFANEGFLRGQRHLLRTIARRKPGNGQNQQPQQPHGQNSSVGACVEVGTFGLDEEVERLKRDKNVLMQELVRLRQQQQTTDNQLQAMVKRIQGMELRQQQMLSFLARAVNSPGFLSQFVQQQNENSKRLTEGNKKRRFKTDGVPNYKPVVPADGQIVKYQPSVIEAAKALLSQMANSDASQKLESFDGSPDSVNGSDISSELTALDHGSPSTHSSGGTLSEGQPISSHPFYPSVSGFIPSGLSTSLSEIQSLQPGATSDALATAQIPNISSLVGPHELSPASLPSNDINNLDLSKLEEMIPRSDVDNSSLSSGGFLDPSSLNGDQTISLDIDDPSADMGIDWSNPLPGEMQQVSNFDDSSWQQFLDLGLLSAIGEAVGSTLENPRQTIEEKPLETEWSEAEMQDLTDQMDLLSSDTKNI